MKSISNYMTYINVLRKWRTLAFKIAFTILIIEDVLTGKKPHELCPWERISLTGIVGVSLIVAGAMIRFWARGHFVKGTLFKTGPYAIVRHPLYLGSSLVMLGVLCVLNDWLNWLVIVPMIVIFYGAAILHEEKSLEKRFGRKWHDYRNSVPAIIPYFNKHLSLMTNERWSWQVYCNTTEKMATILFLSLPLLLEVFEETMF